MRTGGRAGSLLLAALLTLATGCTQTSSGSSASSLADAITRAVYANDYDGTVEHFDADTKAQVTRGDLGQLSDQMHRLGAYQGLTQTNADPDRGLYDFDLKFANGHMTAKVRLDPSGRVGAYRVLPGAPAPATPTTG